MKLLKDVFDFYINSSVHVALTVYSLTWITLLEFGLPYDESVLYFNFFATITGYNFVKYFGIAKFHHRSLSNWLKVIQVFSLLCFVLLGYYMLKLQVKTLICLVVFGVITFFYAIPFLPKNIFIDSNHNLREIGGIKVYVIALVWCGVTVFIPLYNNGIILNWDIILTLIQRFIFILALMMPFEIRDLVYDSLKLSTIPQIIGVKRTKIVGVLLLIVFFFLEFFKDEIIAENILILLAITFLTMLFVVFSKKERNVYYASFWVESIPIYWLLLFLMIR